VIGKLPAEWYHPARLTPCHSPLPGMAARQEDLFPNILPGRPRAFISGPGIVGTETKSTPSNHVSSPIPRKERVQGSARGKMAHPLYLVPQRLSFFYAGASVGINTLPRVQPCHSPQGAVAARGQDLPPAHFPPAHPLLPPTSCAYRKRDKSKFFG
jgi:hypothetical protein